MATGPECGRMDLRLEKDMPQMCMSESKEPRCTQIASSETTAV